ncbi:hypothetical protein [Bradyrhizobium sp. AZCC 2289]|uniref:hypothetical protein n=1 Tax=Bradyrhizobium sp. AZCC 2289 TaxID=3117026 RepID=UPI002FF2DE33
MSMSCYVIKFPRKRRPKGAAPATAAMPATVTTLPRPRVGLLEQELLQLFDSLDEAGKHFMNGYPKTDWTVKRRDAMARKK